MNQTELIKRIRGRIELCRRLALDTTDPLTADALIQIANEGEEDLQRLVAAQTSSALEPIGELSATLIEASAQSVHSVPLSVETTA